MEFLQKNEGIMSLKMPKKEAKIGHFRELEGWKNILCYFLRSFLFNFSSAFLGTLEGWYRKMMLIEIANNVDSRLIRNMDKLAM